jgi:Mn2+/Fe2+ NRAMP family transporter
MFFFCIFHINTLMCECECVTIGVHVKEVEKMGEKKKGGGALIGAAFLMATSAIGPGFLTQTSKFTSDFAASFGFVILF